MGDVAGVLRVEDENGALFWRHYPGVGPLKAEALARVGCGFKRRVTYAFRRSTASRSVKLRTAARSSSCAARGRALPCSQW